MDGTPECSKNNSRKDENEYSATRLMELCRKEGLANLVDNLDSRSPFIVYDDNSPLKVTDIRPATPESIRRLRPALTMILDEPKSKRSSRNQESPPSSIVNSQDSLTYSTSDSSGTALRSHGTSEFSSCGFTDRTAHGRLSGCQDNGYDNQSSHGNQGSHSRQSSGHIIGNGSQGSGHIIGHGSQGSGHVIGHGSQRSGHVVGHVTGHGSQGSGHVIGHGSQGSGHVLGHDSQGNGLVIGHGSQGSHGSGHVTGHGSGGTSQGSQGTSQGSQGTSQGSQGSRHIISHSVDQGSGQSSGIESYPGSGQDSGPDSGQSSGPDSGRKRVSSRISDRSLSVRQNANSQVVSRYTSQATAQYIDSGQDTDNTSRSDIQGNQEVGEESSRCARQLYRWRKANLNRKRPSWLNGILPSGRSPSCCSGEDTATSQTSTNSGISYGSTPSSTEVRHLMEISFGTPSEESGGSIWTTSSSLQPSSHPSSGSSFSDTSGRTSQRSYFGRKRTAFAGPLAAVPEDSALVSSTEPCSSAWEIHSGTTTTTTQTSGCSSRTPDDSTARSSSFALTSEEEDFAFSSAFNTPSVAPSNNTPQPCDNIQQWRNRVLSKRSNLKGPIYVLNNIVENMMNASSDTRTPYPLNSIEDKEDPVDDEELDEPDIPPVVPKTTGVVDFESKPSSPSPKSLKSPKSFKRSNSAPHLLSTPDATVNLESPEDGAPSVMDGGYCTQLSSSLERRQSATTLSPGRRSLSSDEADEPTDTKKQPPIGKEDETLPECLARLHCQLRDLRLAKDGLPLLDADWCRAKDWLFSEDATGTLLSHIDVPGILNILDDTMQEVVKLRAFQSGIEGPRNVKSRLQLFKANDALQTENVELKKTVESMKRVLSQQHAVFQERWKAEVQVSKLEEEVKRLKKQLAEEKQRTALLSIQKRKAEELIGTTKIGTFKRGTLVPSRPGSRRAMFKDTTSATISTCASAFDDPLDELRSAAAGAIVAAADGLNPEAVDSIANLSIPKVSMLLRAATEEAQLCRRLAEHFMQTFKLPGVKDCFEAVNLLQEKLRGYNQCFRVICQMMNLSSDISVEEAIKFLEGKSISGQRLATPYLVLCIVVMQVFSQIQKRLTLPEIPGPCTLADGVAALGFQLGTEKLSAESPRSTSTVGEDEALLLPVGLLDESERKLWRHWGGDCLFHVDLMARLAEENARNVISRHKKN